MPTAIIITYAAVGLFVVLFQLRCRFSLVATTHLIIFLLEIFAYKAVSLYLHPQRPADIDLVALLCLLLLAYMVVFRVGAALIIRSDGVADTVIAFAEQVPIRSIAVWLLVWLTVKAYLVWRYGPLVAFQMITLAKVSGVPYADEMLSCLVIYPALGSIFVYIIQIGCDPAKLLTPITVLALPVAAIFILTGEVGGARRFAALLAVVFALTFVSKRRFEVSPKTVAGGFGLGLLVLAFAGYYQRIRTNAPEVFAESLHRPLSSFSYLELGEALLIPTDHNDVSNAVALRQNLEQRDPPFDVLYRITEVQTRDYGRLALGRLLRQTLINVTPSPFLADKKYVDADDILSDLYSFGHEDLDTTILAELQAEMHFLGYLVTPLLYLALLGMFLRLLDSRAAGLPLIGLSTIACAVSFAGTLETSLEQPLYDLRNLAVLCSIAALVHLFSLMIRNLGRPRVRY